MNTQLSEDKSLPKNPTTGRFKEYWDQTESGIPVSRHAGTVSYQFPRGFGEEARFEAVLRMIEEDTVARQQNRPKIGKDITEHFADGKWHDVPAIAAKIGFPEDHVRDTLERMREKHTYGHKAEKREVGTVPKFRIFFEGDDDRNVGLAELTDKLTPFIRDLMAEGRKNMATMSPPTVLRLAGKIQQQIDEWAGRPVKETGLRKVSF